MQIEATEISSTQPTKTGAFFIAAKFKDLEPGLYRGLYRASAAEHRFP